MNKLAPALSSSLVCARAPAFSSLFLSLSLPLSRYVYTYASAQLTKWARAAHACLYVYVCECGEGWSCQCRGLALSPFWRTRARESWERHMGGERARKTDVAGPSENPQEGERERGSCRKHRKRANCCCCCYPPNDPRHLPFFSSVHPRLSGSSGLCPPRAALYPCVEARVLSDRADALVAFLSLPLLPSLSALPRGCICKQGRAGRARRDGGDGDGSWPWCTDAARECLVRVCRVGSRAIIRRKNRKINEAARWILMIQCVLWEWSKLQIIILRRSCNIY